MSGGGSLACSVVSCTLLTSEAPGRTCLEASLAVDAFLERRRAELNSGAESFQTVAALAAALREAAGRAPASG